jgi:hypothetical protein
MVGRFWSVLIRTPGDSVIWDAVTAIATVISMMAYVITAYYIRAQLRGMEKERFLSVTNDLFTTWQSHEFMESQLWILHKMEASSWTDFVAAHRGDRGEIAFHRVGSFYDRVGTLVRLALIDEREILPTIGGHAIAVWNRIAPLVHEARRIENSVLFREFERLLPACHECYVPTLGRNVRVAPFELAQPEDAIDPKTLKRRLDAGERVSLLDVRQPSQVAEDGLTLPNALLVPLNELEQRVGELPKDREIVTFCA